MIAVSKPSGAPLIRPPFKWFDVRYPSDIKEDCMGKERYKPEDTSRGAAQRRELLQDRPRLNRIQATSTRAVRARFFSASRFTVGAFEIFMLSQSGGSAWNGGRVLH